ncbi:hypothetical protein [Methylomagnum ishizawai]|uniref:hypothetical protein n=1 Tax=Methylomagnum ishizawai TaxID=1760988 RepID=UPI001C32830C|nr:hypothetical protein [Methylomagnum ishizawai]BBL73178.1 hypothetical protein MishRS11D_02760 [Methylomagnum ishizawai]
MSNITVSRREAGDGAKPYVVLIDGQPWLDRQNHPRRFGDSKRAWNAAYKRFARQLAGAIQAQAEAAALEAQAPEAVPAPSRPYGCIDPADKLTHADVRRIGLKPGPAPLTPEQVEAAYAARAEARAHARAGQVQAAPLQDGPGAELRRQAAELRCGAGYADDYRAYLADLDAAAALEARARRLEMQAAAPAPGPAAIPTEPDHDTGAQPMTPNTATPHPSMASTIAAHATLMERVKAEQTQALAQEQETAPEAAFAQAEQLIANRLAAHIDEIESFEEFKSFARGYFSQGMYNKLYYTNTLRAIWDAQHPQRPEPAPQAPAQAAHGADDDMAGIRKALDIIKRGDPMLEPAAQEETVGAGASAVMLDEALGGDPTDEEIEENIEAQEREETLAIMAGEVKADPAPVHSKARWHEGFADGEAGREPTHDVADYRSGWNHGAVCRAQREAARAMREPPRPAPETANQGHIAFLETQLREIDPENPALAASQAWWDRGGVCGYSNEDFDVLSRLSSALDAARKAVAAVVKEITPALVAVYNGSDMTEGEFAALAGQLPEAATVGDVIDAARSLRGLEEQADTGLAPAPEAAPSCEGDAWEAIEEAKTAEPAPVVEEAPAPTPAQTTAFSQGYSDAMEGYEKPDLIESMPVFNEGYMEGWNAAQSRQATEAKLQERLAAMPVQAEPAQPAPLNFDELLAAHQFLVEQAVKLADRLAAAEARIGKLEAAPVSRPAPQPAPKAATQAKAAETPATPRQAPTPAAAKAIEDSAPYKRGFAAARKGGKADADWFQGYGLGTADKAEGRASREAEMAGRSLRSGYVAGFTGANETTNTRWVAGYKAGLPG